MVSSDVWDDDTASVYDAEAAAMFRSEAVDPVVEMLASLAGGGRALELAIGTGRIGLPLLRRGVPVSGIELSTAMVGRLRTKVGADELPVAIGDMATTHVPGEFALVYLVFNTITNLRTQAEQVACFRNAAAHLAPGGRFVIEVSVPPLRRLPPGQVAVPFEVSEEHTGFDTFDLATQESSVAPLHAPGRRQHALRRRRVPLRVAGRARPHGAARRHGARSAVPRTGRGRRSPPTARRTCRSGACRPSCASRTVALVPTRRGVKALEGLHARWQGGRTGDFSAVRERGGPGVPVIEVDALRRTYGGRTGLRRSTRQPVEAVKGISFEVERGELFGLLGPNGAGKTTTIKMLITLLLPTGGSARVLGHDVVAEPREVRRRIGYVFGGDRGLYERLSGLDNLRYFAELYGVPPREQKQRIGELLELVGLAGREDERVEGYSRGMRQRLHIARGLLHKPEALFLDEPSIGIDPVGARELRQTVANLTTQGVTVLLTTHYMFEADELCDRIAVIAGGRIVAEGTPADLKDARRGRARDRDRGLRRSPSDRIAHVRALDGRHAVSVEDGDQCAAARRTHGGRRATATQAVLALPRRDAARPGLHPRAHPRGRLRRAGARGMRMLRLGAPSPGGCS